MKILSYFLATILLFLAIFLAWSVWQNNREVAPPDQAELQQHFNRTAEWFNTNYGKIENNHNPILWWMLKQAAEKSQNKSLNSVYLKYKKNYLDPLPPNLSTPMFDRFYRPSMPDMSALSHLRDYQLFFFYGLSCDSDLGSEPVIQQQMSPNFCSLHYLQPRCITHQLMGLRFIQRFKCDDQNKVDKTISELQSVVISELTWDFRVGDAYIQRILMLVDSGANEQVKPIWIKNVLNAQNSDGSWDDLDPIVSLPGGYVLAHTSTIPRIRQPKADFHATVQALWLLSILLNEAEKN